jgi:hypothetical protein
VAFQFAYERLALRLDLRLRGGVDHIIVVGGDFFVQPVGRMGEKISVLMHRTALSWRVAPERGKSFFEARRAIDDDEFWRFQAAVNQISRSVRQAASLSPPMFLTFEGQPDDRLVLRERAFQASQSPFTLRQTRLTVSLCQRRSKTGPLGRSKTRPVWGGQKARMCRVPGGDGQVS